MKGMAASPIEGWYRRCVLPYHRYGCCRQRKGFECIFCITEGIPALRNVRPVEFWSETTAIVFGRGETVGQNGVVAVFPNCGLTISAVSILVSIAVGHIDGKIEARDDDDTCVVGRVV